MKIRDIVWFQAYEDHEPIQGRITRIGSQTELGIGWDETDERVFYELETINKSDNFVFTKTTKRWLSTTKQEWIKPDLYIKNLD